MKYRQLVMLLLTIVLGKAGFSQSARQDAEHEAKGLATQFILSTSQEDSLKNGLITYYTNKEAFLQRTTRTVSDTRELKRMREDLLKRVFTQAQYQRYDSVRQEHLKLMKQRIGTSASKP